MTLAVGSKQAIGYLRVSTTGQAGERHSSLETQEEHFLSHGERHGYQPGRTFVDVANGRRDETIGTPTRRCWRTSGMRALMCW